MFGCRNGITWGGKFFKFSYMGFTASHMKIKGLIEVAIEQIAVPGYREK